MKTFTDEEGKKYNLVDPDWDEHHCVLIEPVKKTKGKKKFYLSFHSFSVPGYMIDEELDLTPTTANKLSEAISALVEYVQLGKFDSAMFVGLDDKIQEARESFEESQ
jgi:hypothetical protein